MKINEEYIPETLEDAIDYLYSCCDEKDIEYIKTEGESQAFEMPNGQKLNFYGHTMHHGYGQMIRNAWGLWNGSVLKDHFIERFGLGHADDMSGLIIEGLEAKIQGKPYTERQINRRVRSYKRHWRKVGIDPLTQEKA